MSNSMVTKQRLQEIDMMRPLVIVLLVLMHAFVMFNPQAYTWPLPSGIHEVEAYHWIQEVSYSFLLESFTFISGYVFGFALFVRNKEYTFIGLFSNKAKRLMIPCVVFGLLYSLIDYDKPFYIITYTYDLLRGIGHMWYLPMLFLCFLITWGILKIRIKDKVALALLLLLSILSYRVPTFWSIKTTCYYLFFFYLGVSLIKYRDRLKHLSKYYLVLWGGDLLMIIPLIALRQYLQAAEFCPDTITILASRFAAKGVTILYSLLGTFALYLSCLYFTSHHTLNARVIKISGYCMGIYIFQQFFLCLLFYHTFIPQLIGTYALPFVGFFTSLILSYVFTVILCKSSIGRYLLQ